MSSTTSKLRLVGAVAALVTLALAMSCRGFFVKPTLSSISVSPSTSTIDTGTTNNTVQMRANGTFNDGSTGSAAVSWSIAPDTTGDPVAANISASGLVSSVTVGKMTVTATAIQSSSITSTATVTVVPPTLATITLSPTGTLHPGAGITQAFTATGKDSGGNSFDITNVATWVSSNTSVATIDANGVATMSSTTSTGTTNITASLDGVTSQATMLALP
jgi:hypothetical protein